MPEVPAHQPAVELCNVSVSFGDRVVLDKVNLNLRPGLVHGIVGRGGSGRTTLLRVMATILRPDSGSVSVLGRDLSDPTPQALEDVRPEIGFQFQNLALFDSMTVIDNVLFSLTGGTPESATENDRIQAMQALDLLGLADASTKLVPELSGGMQRRLAIARAFAPSRARLVIFDDPAGGLDPVSASRMLRQITTRSGVTAGRTVVISGHDMKAMLANCDLLHVLHEGNIIFSGSPDQAVASSHPEVRPIIHGTRAAAPRAEIAR